MLRDVSWMVKPMVKHFEKWLSFVFVTTVENLMTGQEIIWHQGDAI